LPSPVFDVGIFTAGPPGIADAPLVNVNDNPAAPNTGRALLRRFRFMGKSFQNVGQMFEFRTWIVRLAVGPDKA
jgi:hypothetical protein